AIIGLVTVLIIAGLNPLFVNSNKKEIVKTSVSGRTGSLKVVGNGGLIFILPADPVYEYDDISITVIKPNHEAADGAIVHFNGGNGHQTDSAGHVSIRANVDVPGDEDFREYSIFASWYDNTADDTLTGYTDIDIYNRYLVIYSTHTSSTNPIDEAKRFEVGIKDQHGQPVAAYITFEGDTKWSTIAGFYAPHLSSKQYDLYDIVDFPASASKKKYKSASSTIYVRNVNCAPNTPSKLSGPKSGALGYSYTYTAKA
ncbi:unnamed protein product, partial [marine sediment metagenome]